jgi:hypothetical protein
VEVSGQLDASATSPPRGKSQRYLLGRRLSGPKNGLDVVPKREKSCPLRKPNHFTVPVYLEASSRKALQFNHLIESR